MRNLIEPNHSLNEIFEIVNGEFRKAVALKRHPFKYVTLSTSDGTNVNSRYVVLRKFTDSNSFIIFTDTRSEKMQDLKSNDNCNLLFYHNGKKLQVRVNGKAIIHKNDESTKQYWAGVKGNSDKAYTSLIPPGEKIKNPQEAFQWDETLTSSQFVVLEILPIKIEALQLNRDEHIRAKFSNVNGNLEATFLAP